MHILQKGKNLNDNNVLLNIVEVLNLDVVTARSIIETDLFSNEVNQEIAEASAIGVSGVPFLYSIESIQYLVRNLLKFLSKQSLKVLMNPNL